MRLLYDEEGDVLDVIFTDKAQRVSEAGYELRRGVVIFVTKEMSPVQLTLVNFRRLTELPVVHFDLLQTQQQTVRDKLLSLIASPPLSTILRIDPVTNYGHVVSPELLDVCNV